MVKNNGKSYKKWDDLGGKPTIFGNTHIGWIHGTKGILFFLEAQSPPFKKKIGVQQRLFFGNREFSIIQNWGLLIVFDSHGIYLHEWLVFNGQIYGKLMYITMYILGKYTFLLVPWMRNGKLSECQDSIFSEGVFVWESTIESGQITIFHQPRFP